MPDTTLSAFLAANPFIVANQSPPANFQGGQKVTLALRGGASVELTQAELALLLSMESRIIQQAHPGQVLNPQRLAELLAARASADIRNIDDVRTIGGLAQQPAINQVITEVGQRYTQAIGPNGLGYETAVGTVAEAGRNQFIIVRSARAPGTPAPGDEGNSPEEMIARAIRISRDPVRGDIMFDANRRSLNDRLSAGPERTRLLDFLNGRDKTPPDAVLARRRCEAFRDMLVVAGRQERAGSRCSVVEEAINEVSQSTMPIAADVITSLIRRLPATDRDGNAIRNLDLADPQRQALMAAAGQPVFAATIRGIETHLNAFDFARPEDRMDRDEASRFSSRIEDILNSIENREIRRSVVEFFNQRGVPVSISQSRLSPQPEDAITQVRSRLQEAGVIAATDIASNARLPGVVNANSIA